MYLAESRRRRRKGRGETQVVAWFRGWMTRVARLCAIRVSFSRAIVVVLVVCITFPLFVEYFYSGASFPRALWGSPSRHPTCSVDDPLYSLNDFSFCTGACRSECFPRVQGICFSSDRVRICQRNSEVVKHEGGPRNERAGAGIRKRKYRAGKELVPTFMRFLGELLTVPVVHSSCDQGWHWISGLSMVADQRFLPKGKPNPHHEAEKLIPALLLAQYHGVANATLQWFATKSELSTWAQGFLDAFKSALNVRYHNLPVRTDDSICFEDAILFSGPTHVRYVPSRETNAWLRERVLSYCSIPLANASWPESKAIILDRNGGPRQLANRYAIGEMVTNVLHVPVEHRETGVGSFCDQVHKVAGDDFFVVPHGSQNVNFLFARPGAVVIEVFPYLFYTDAFRNFTHAAQIQHYPLLGALPPSNLFLRVFSLLGWDICYNHVRWCKNYARSQAIYADLIELKRILHFLQSGPPLM